jgi:hypothetical protein
MPHRFANAGVFAALLLGLLGCRGETQDSRPLRATPTAASPAPAPDNAAPVEPERYDLIGHLDACDVEHDGALLDLGTPSLDVRRKFSLKQPQISVVDREGSSFERMSTTTHVFDVWLDSPIEKPMLSLRVHGGASKHVHLSVDDIRFGSVRLPGAETRVIATPSVSTPLARGRHRITLRLSAVPRANKAPLAEIDWLRLSESDPEPARYAAPTLRDITDDVALERLPKKSLVLRAPS